MMHYFFINALNVIKLTLNAVNIEHEGGQPLFLKIFSAKKTLSPFQHIPILLER